ncbi:MAG: VWA domain-containing protein [Desulfobulbaceae bacterium]|nr:VWA domain-containing protein [Desulfobulbaceae bacterium]
MLPTDFHFLRPGWFLALLPAGLLFLALWAARLRTGGWEKAISGKLLPHLLEGQQPGARRRWPLGLLLVAWLLAVFSLAGPVWKKMPQAVRHKEDGLVIIQDLSLSFYAKDLSPNRLTRARHKLLDLLHARKEGLTALVVYSGDAHVVCPLTDDTATIAALVPELEPGIMPSYGSNLKAAVELALQLCRAASLSRGRLLLLTDEVEPAMAVEVGKLLRGQDFTLAVLGVGTAGGGPIPKGDNGFLQDEHGNIVIPRLDGDQLAKLAAANGGRYSEIRIDDGDFTYLLGSGSRLPLEEEYRQVEREFDQWREEGHWLLLLLLPLALVAFRRGWIIAALLLAVLPARPSQALEWRDLWLRKDQQGAQALAAGDPRAAARLFQTPEWQGAAEYRAGNFAGAVESFATLGSAEAHYNRGNGLAQLGKLEEALQAYDQALKIDPQLADARANRQLVAEQLRQQEQQPGPEQKAAPSGPGQSGDKEPPAGRGQDQKPPTGGQGQEQKGGGQKPPGAAGQEKKGQTGQMAGATANPQDQNGAKSGAESQPNEAASRAGQEKIGAQESGRSAAPKNQLDRLGKPSSEGRKVLGAPEEALQDNLTPEQRQELELRLRQVPDNPGGLLRRKFEYQYQNNRQRGAGDRGKIW